VQTHPFSTPQKKPKAIFSAGKIMTAVFWNSKGIIHLDFPTGKKIINVQYYSNLLNESEVGNPLKAKKKAGFSLLPPGQLSSSNFCFNDGNLLKLKWDLLPHLPYSSDLAPSAYHLFGPMKRVLGGKRFRNNDEVIAAVQNWIHKQLQTFFETGIKKLLERWHKCMAVSRDYIEK
jgi:hypothetical protein